MIFADKHSHGPVTGYEVGIAPMGRPIKTVYVYHIDSILIDTGPHHLGKKISSMLSGSNVASILLTHHHEDHSGNASVLKEQHKAPVNLHPYGVAKLSKGFNILPYQRILFGNAPPLQAKTCPELIEAENITLKAIHTPGHSRDHTVYHAEKEGWLFSGDLYVGERIQFFRGDERIDEQIESLQKIANLDFDLLFCSHRACMKDGPARIKRKLDYFISFKEQVIQLHGKGMGEKEIIQRLQKRNDLPIRLFTMGNACFGHMVRSSLSGLRN